MVFSIVYEKNFLVMPGIKRSRRHFNVLDLLELTDRCVLKGDDILEKSKLDNIDYVAVNKRLKVLRLDSMCYIEKSLRVE